MKPLMTELESNKRSSNIIEAILPLLGTSVALVILLCIMAAVGVAAMMMMKS
jgi:hypothetical protein